jgi:hypothetical protein
MAGIHNYTWAQGEDLVMSLVYKSGPLGEEAPVDLTGYSLRMDIALTDGTRVYTFNSDAIADVDPETVGDTPDTNLEVTLGAAGEINITVPRSVTLPGGGAYPYLDAEPPVLIYNYDIFLRDTVDKQKKILQGQISIEKSVTLWE